MVAPVGAALPWIRRRGGGATVLDADFYKSSTDVLLYAEDYFMISTGLYFTEVVSPESVHS